MSGLVNNFNKRAERELAIRIIQPTTDSLCCTIKYLVNCKKEGTAAFAYFKVKGKDRVYL